MGQNKLTLKALGTEVKVFIIVHVSVPPALNLRAAAITLKTNDSWMGVRHAYKEQVSLL